MPTMPPLENSTTPPRVVAMIPADQRRTEPATVKPRTLWIVLGALVACTAIQLIVNQVNGAPGTRAYDHDVATIGHTAH